MAEDGTFDDTEALEAGRRLFAQDCRFITAAARLEQLPEGDLVEVAFAGRSNVGKSSLVNALTGRRTLARTSNTPGRTREIIFFLLGERLMLADLPGYGFARAPKAMVANWTTLIESYLKGRPPLRRVCLLIDARHGIKASDRAAMKLMDAAAVVYQVVLTKTDKLSKNALGTREREVAAEAAGHTAAHPRIIATSARDGLGVPELRATLAALASRDDLG